MRVTHKCTEDLSKRVTLESSNRAEIPLHRAASPEYTLQTELCLTDVATELLAALPMQAIVFAFATTSYLLGPGGGQALKVRLEKRSNWIPVLLP